MFEPSVAAGLMDALFTFALSKGADAGELSIVSGYTPNELRPADDRVPYDQYVLLMRSAKRLTGDEALALRFGEEVEMSQFSVVGLLDPPAGSAEDVIGYVNRYARLLVDVPGQPAYRLQFARRGGAYWLADMRPQPNDFPELTESTFARMVSTCRRMGIEYPITRLQVTHSKPAHHSEYGRLFRVPVRFGAKWNAVAFSEELLRLVPHGIRPSYAQHLAAAHAEMLLNRLDDQSTFAGRVAAAIARSVEHRRTSVDAVAKQFGISRQTLYRRLKREGVTFEDVSEAVLRELAQSQIRLGRSVAEVADLLGYSDRAAFSKAFKRWTGGSPAAAAKSLTPR